MDHGSSQRFAAHPGVWISVTPAGLETARMDRRQLVVLGCGSCCRVSTVCTLYRAGNHHAAIQQVYATDGRHIAPTPLCTGATHKFPNQPDRSDGWQQTFAS